MIVDEVLERSEIGVVCASRIAFVSGVGARTTGDFSDVGNMADSGAFDWPPAAKVFAALGLALLVVLPATGAARVDIVDTAAAPRAIGFDATCAAVATTGAAAFDVTGAAAGGLV